jgi:predicted secreted protein
MFYRDRLSDEYETHQRNHSYLLDELDNLVADATVKRQSWYKNVLARIGDILILAGNSMKERDCEFTSTTLSSLTRQRNETIFE